MGVIERLADRITKRGTAVVKTYAATVKDIVAGNDPPVEQLEQILNAAGKSLDDLGADVEHLRTRRRLQLQLDGEPALQKELNANLIRQAGLRETFESAIVPLEKRALNLQEELRLFDGIRAELLRSCKDPAVRLREADLQARMAEANKRRAVVLEALARIPKPPTDAAPATALLPVASELQQKDNTLAREKSERTTKMLRAELAALDKQLAAMQSEHAEIYRLKIES